MRLSRVEKLFYPDIEVGDVYECTSESQGFSLYEPFVITEIDHIHDIYKYQYLPPLPNYSTTFHKKASSFKYVKRVSRANT